MTDDAPKKARSRLSSDEDAERFVAEADLSEYDLTRLQPVNFAVAPHDPTIAAPITQRMTENEGG